MYYYIRGCDLSAFVVQDPEMFLWFEPPEIQIP